MINILDERAVGSVFAEFLWHVHSSSLESWKSEGSTERHKRGTFNQICKIWSSRCFCLGWKLIYVSKALPEQSILSSGGESATD